MPNDCSFEYCDYSSGQRFPTARLEGKKIPFLSKKRASQGLIDLDNQHFVRFDQQLIKELGHDVQVGIAEQLFSYKDLVHDLMKMLNVIKKRRGRGLVYSIDCPSSVATVTSLLTTSM